MAKNFLNDIRPANRDERRSRVDDEPLEVSNRPVQLPPRFREKSFQPMPERRSRKILWTIVVLVIIGAIIALASFFSNAKVTITQKSEDISLENSPFVATINGDDKTLSFKLVKLTGSAEKVVTGGMPTTISSKATGRVILYNNFSSAPQKLDIETRLATSDGKIYKTDNALTIPGTKTENGKVIPGSIEVGVHADQPGPTYNIGLSDFTIFGFKGSPKYTKFYGRSKTQITGGASGPGIALSEADAKIAHEAALTTLKEKLIAQATASLPDSAIMLPGSYVIREDLDSGQVVGDKNMYTVKGALYGVLFDEHELAQKIASVAISQYDGGEINIPELKTFTVDIKNKDAITDTTSTVSLGISGKGNALWVVPKEKVIAKLLGSKKRDLGVNLSEFPSVKKATVSIMPSWSMTLPEKPNSIKVLID